MSFVNSQVEIPADHLKFQYPYIQYLRGDLKDKNPLIKNGCFEMNLGSWELFLGDDWSHGQIETIVSQTGKERESYLSGSFQIAVLASVQLWGNTEGNIFQYYQGYQAGAKGKFRILGMVRELEGYFDDLVVFTFGGMTGKYVKDAIKSFEQSYLGLANKLASTTFPTYAFYLPLVQGNKVEGKGSSVSYYITPPRLAYSSKDLNQKLLEELYIGDDGMQWVQSKWKEVQAWTDQQNNLWDNSATPKPQTPQNGPPTATFNPDDLPEDPI